MTTTGYTNLKLNGTSLQTLGWNVLALTGTDSLPGRRGKNLSTPYQDGDYSFGEKFYESRSFFINMVVLPQDINGVVNGADGGRFNLRENYDMLKGVFQQNAGLQLFSMEVKDGAGGFVTRDIEVEVMRTINVKEYKKVALSFTVELEAPRPFWRELPLISSTHLAKTVFPYNFNIDTAGNAPIGDLVITIDVNAASSTPSLTCTSTGDKITFNDPNLILNDQIIIDLGAKSFTKNTTRADTFVTRDTAWFMRLPPAASLAMVLDATSGNYDLTLEYYKKWL